MNTVDINIISNFEEDNARLLYTLSFIENHPLIKNSIKFFLNDSSGVKLDIFYGGISHNSKEYFIPRQDLFFLKSKALPEVLFANPYRSNSNLIYSVEFKQKASADLLSGNTFGFDIFETIFFHISRYEEIFASDHDNGVEGWLQEKKHFLIKEKLFSTPIVDILVTQLKEILLGNTAKEKTSYSISHDVDILFKFQTPFHFFRSLLATIYHKRGFALLIGSISWYYKYLRGKEKDPYDYFQELILSDNVFKEKTIYFMSGGNSEYDNKYSIEEKRVGKIMDLALESGYTIGFHPSYNAGFSEKMYSKEKEILEKIAQSKVIANRQHWLRFRWDITPYLFAPNSIQKDSSLGYNKHLGFRCGTGFPYCLYDFKNEKPFDWIEHPMAFMESAAINMAKKEGIEPSKLMRDFIEKNKQDTHIVFNFHNSNFDNLTEVGNAMRDFYENQFLNLLKA